MKRTWKIGIAAGTFEAHLVKEIERASRPEFVLQRADSLDCADAIVSNDSKIIEQYSARGMTCLQIIGTRKDEVLVPGVTKSSIERFIPSLVILIEKSTRIGDSSSSLSGKQP